MATPQRNAFVRRAPRPSSDTTASPAWVSLIRPAVDLDAVVSELNSVYCAKGLETARAIGNLVLKALFDDSIAAMRSGTHPNHVSLRRLQKHPKLQVSYSFISQSLNVIEQLRQLPDVGNKLSFTQHRALAPVKDVDQKRMLAQRALAESMTAKELIAEVRKLRTRAAAPRQGRPRVSGVQSLIASLKQLSATLPVAGLDDAAFFPDTNTDATQLLAAAALAARELPCSIELLHASVVAQLAGALP